MKEYETEDACSAIGEGHKILAQFWWGNLKERDHLEGLDVEGRIILNCYLNKRNVRL